MNENLLNEEGLNSNNASPIEMKEDNQNNITTESLVNNEELPIDSVTNQISNENEEAQQPVITENYDEYSKEQLVTQLEKVVQFNDILQAKPHVGLIKVAFRKIVKDEQQQQLQKFLEEGGKKEEFQAIEDELEKRFNEAFAIYKQRKQTFDEEQEKQKQQNLLEKQKILEEIKLLIDSEEELKKTYDAFKALQNRWKEIGQVPQKDKTELWQNYHFFVEKFFDKVKINKELKDLDLKKNLEAKIAICEKTEELLIEENIAKSFQLLQRYHEEWKEIGPVPADKKEEVWKRFSDITEKLNQRRREYYQKLHDEQQANYQAKLNLCETMEQIAATIYTSPKEWNKKTEEVEELQKTWKTFGAAPKKVNNEVWLRFRQAIDQFFSNKKEYYSKMVDEQTENYNQKLALCLQAEALKNSQDWKRTTDELIRLQEEWKKIGPVSKKHSDKIWKRFRAACDEFFTNKNNYFANITSIEAENQQKKEALIAKVNEYQFGDNNAENLEILKDFQRQWTQIGHVPIKVKEKLQNEFRAAINKQFDKLKINSSEKSTLAYKSKLESIKSSPNANSLISKERTFILNKISTLKNDIKLWENNIGFFANSKNADVLKQEVEKKIEKAKEEIKSLEEKLKLLKEK